MEFKHTENYNGYEIFFNVDIFWACIVHHGTLLNDLTNFRRLSILFFIVLSKETWPIAYNINSQLLRQRYCYLLSKLSFVISFVWLLQNTYNLHHLLTLKVLMFKSISQTALIEIWSLIFNNCIFCNFPGSWHYTELSGIKGRCNLWNVCIAHLDFLQ